MGLGGRHFKWHKCSMEYSMEFHRTLVPPNEIWLSSMDFHGIIEIVILINTMLPLTCMEYSMELHGTLESPNKKSSSSMGFHGTRGAPFQLTQVFHGIPWNIPWNSMELWCRQMKYHLVPWNCMEYSMEFHGTLVPPNEVSFSSMEFHGTLRLSFYDMLPWTSKGYSMEFHGTLESTNKKKNTKFHGIPWN